MSDHDLDRRAANLQKRGLDRRIVRLLRDSLGTEQISFLERATPDQIVALNRAMTEYRAALDGGAAT